MMQMFHPTTLEEAVALLVEHQDARCLAGGQTLVAMLNLGLLDPSALISLRKIEGLDTISEQPDGTLVLGATVTQAALARKHLPGAHCILSEAAKQVAHPAIRNFGTIGGGLCHADPAADLPPAFTAADATYRVIGPNGPRTLSSDAFFVDYLTTALDETEVLTEISIPAAPANSVGHYLKYARVDGDYATVSVAVTLEIEKDVCSAARVVLGSCAPTPLRLAEADAAIVDTTLDEESLNKAGALLQDAAEPIDDMRGSADYRRRIIPGLVVRAIRAAKAKAGAP